MSIKDITNYVRQTPGNTNPNVVRSMVEAQVGEYVDEAVNEALRKLGINEGTSFVEVVPKTALEQWTDGSDGPTVAMIPEMFEVGGIYRVETDSGVFTGVCRRETVDGTEMHVIGNAAFTGAADSGESFGAATLIYGTETTALLYDYNKGTSMTVSKQTETITPIDPKYLPEGGVGYTEDETKSLTFDGGLTGKESILVGEVGAATAYLIKLSDITFTPSDFIGATRAFLSLGSGETIIKRITDVSFEDIGFGYNVSDDEDILFAIVTEDSEPLTKGIWTSVSLMDGSWYGCIQIDYKAETIHPIDPKYLPSPVVIDLAEYGIDIVTPTLSGGGNFTVNNSEFWVVLTENYGRDLRFMASFNGVDFQLFPSLIAINEGSVTAVAMTLHAVNYGVMIKGEVYFNRYLSGEDIGVNCIVVVTQSTYS